MAWYEYLYMTAGVLAVLILPFVAGTLLARGFRMPDHGWKIGLILFSLTLGTVVTLIGWPPRLGIDLSGGVTLIYEIDSDQQEVAKALDNTTMDKLAAAISRRVDPKGLEEITIRPYGENQIQIIVPNADEADVRRIESKVSRAGTLEFRILANRLDHEDLIERAGRMPPTERRLLEIINGEQVERARWVPLHENAKNYAQGGAYATRTSARGEQEILVIVDPYHITGDQLRNARPTHDNRMHDAVGFDFDMIGAEKFRRLTSENLPTQSGGTPFHRNLAIILDGYLYTAPQINEIIGGSGIIEGDFTKEKVEEDVAVLNAGSLPAVLEKEPSSRTYIGPTLGQDTIRRGTQAMGLSLLVTFLFMVVYYRFAGFIASMAMLMNLLLLVAMMILFRAALTLPGLAGIALTVGMAVDANVLIYERMREELARGTSLRMAIRNGFSRAMTTIIDSNLTTLITAVVLYAIGTDQIKGFALTLILGIALSMFTAIFCARVAFDIAEKMRWVTNLHMMKLLDNTNYDFIGKRRIAIIGSLILIGIGMVGIVARGKNLLDIDFTGGSEVALLFKEPQQIAEVRQSTERVLPDVTVSDVKPYEGEQANLRFIISTSNQDVDDVEHKLVDAFGPNLAKGTMSYKQVPVPPPSATPAAALPGTSPAAGLPGGTAPKSSGTPPGSNKQGAVVNPSAEGLLALADFQQPAEQPAGASQPASDAPAAAAPATADAPAATPTEQPPATAAPAAEAPSTPSSPATPAAAPGGTPSTPATTPTTPAAGPTTVAPIGERSRFELDFTPQRIAHDVLKDEVEALLQRIGKQAASHTLIHPEYVEGSNDAFDKWTLEIGLPAPDAEQVVQQLKQVREGTPVFPASSKIGGRVAGDTQWQAVYALVASLVFIVAYIWLRFEKVIFGIAAVVALVHDVLITLGFIAVSLWLSKVFGFLMIDPFKINLTIVAALLTIIGYSLNDTIVVFDRIREVRGKSPYFSEEMLNRSINFTLGRTVLTGLTTIMVVIILYVIGGAGIHGFAYTLIIGLIVGTFSSIYVASPVLLWLGKQPEGAARGAEVANRRAAVSER